MNYTQNYHLPQWEKSDRVLMDDFNDAMSGIEDGLSAAVKSAAAGAANALSAAQAAQATANKAFSPSYLPYKTGTYTGNGGTMTIELGFKPSFVIISGQQRHYGTYYPDFVLVGENIIAMGVTFLDTGIRIVAATDSSMPNSNATNHPYSYIAFR